MPQELRARNKVLVEAEDRFRLLNRRYLKRVFTLREVLWILRDLKQPSPRRVYYDVTVIQEEENGPGNGSPTEGKSMGG